MTLSDILRIRDRILRNVADKYDKDNPLTFAAILLTLAVLVIGSYSAIFYVLFKGIGLLIAVLAIPTKSYLVATLLGGLALVLGIALYNFRVVARIQYGILETMFGVAFIFSSSTPVAGVSDDRVQLLQIGAGIYIIVRGLDNVKTGLEAQPTHPLWVVWNKFVAPTPRAEIVSAKDGFDQPEEVGLMAGIDHETVEPWREDRTSDQTDPKP